jgi:small-conductance mechanosensitive channel
MDSSSMRAARPRLVRGTLAGLVAVLGLIIARFGQLTDEGTERGGEATSTEQALATAGALVLLFAGVIAVRAFSKAVRVALEARVGDARGAPLGIVVSAFGYLLLLLLILSALGAPLEGLFLGGALTGVVIGIAAQQTLGNVFAGIVLLAIRPFNVGENIALRSGPLGGEYEGSVTDMGLFYVRMLTPEGPVQLPNAGVLAAAIGPGSRAPKQEEAPADEREQQAPTSEGGAPSP